MVLKEKNKIKDYFANFLQGKSEELLHKLSASGNILFQKIAVQRQNKRADSKSGISPKNRTVCSVKAGNCKISADRMEAFPLQAKEILLTLPDDKHLLSFGEGL